MLDNSGPESLQDAYYNALRLLFQVYSQYQKNDGVDFNRLTNVAEVLTGDSSSVVQDISAIVVAHERSIAVSAEKVPLDLLFNAALVYTDAIDETDDLARVTVYATRAQELFREVLKQQIDEFQEYLQFAKTLPQEGNEAVESDTDAGVPDAQESYSSSKTPQPPDILDTAISGLQFCLTVLETLGATLSSHAGAVNYIESFARDLVTVADDLIQNFSESSNAAAIEEPQRNEYLVAKSYVHALSCSDLATVYEVWDAGDLPNIPLKYMLAADTTESVLERLELDKSGVGQQDGLELYWTALSKMNIYFKSAHELLNAEYQSKKAAAGSVAGVGALIDQICRVFIARSDIDLQRSQIQNEQGQKNSQVLLNNAKAFLKNAMNLAKVSGGLREMAVEKAQRERRRYEAVSRLCVLEGKTLPEELNSILGSGMWEEDLAGYRELWYFHKFLR